MTAHHHCLIQQEHKGAEEACLCLYLENLSLVVVQHLVLEAVVADWLHTRQAQDLNQGIFLGNAVFYIRVHLHSGVILRCLGNFMWNHSTHIQQFNRYSKLLLHWTPFILQNSDKLWWKHCGETVWVVAPVSSRLQGLMCCAVRVALLHILVVTCG